MSGSGASIDEEMARTALARELLLGEEFLWTGRPALGVLWQRADMIRVLFMTVWTGFALFWTYRVVTSARAPAFFVLWGLMFVGVGLYHLVGRFFMDASLRARTFYAVTNRRALLLDAGATRKLTSINLETNDQIVFEESVDGSGNIVFGEPVSNYDLFRGNRAVPPPTFVRIDGAREVFDKLTNAKQALRLA